MKRIFLFVLFSISPFIANCEEWEISESLFVSPPDSLDVTFQVIEGIDPNASYVYGWKGEDLSYLVMTEMQPSILPFEEYWNNLINGMRIDPEISDIENSDTHSFETQKSQNASCQKFKYQLDGDSTLQYICIVIGDKLAYYVIGSSVDGDMNYLSDSLKTLMATAFIAK